MILGALLLGMGVLTVLIGIVADLIAVNRQLLEKLLAQHAAAGGRAGRTRAAVGRAGAAPRSSPDRPPARSHGHDPLAPPAGRADRRRQPLSQVHARATRSPAFW